jgi:hypothetical protein
MHDFWTTGGVIRMAVVSGVGLFLGVQALAWLNADEPTPPPTHPEVTQLCEPGTELKADTKDGETWFWCEGPAGEITDTIAA